MFYSKSSHQVYLIIVFQNVCLGKAGLDVTQHRAEPTIQIVQFRQDIYLKIQ